MKRVYVIGCEGHAFCKIGISANPSRRADQLTAASPWPCFVAYQSEQLSDERAREIEAAALESLCEFSAHGEWVSAPRDFATQTVASFVSGVLCSGLDLMEAFDER